MRTLITNGTVVNADGSYAADVLIDGETIAAVGAVGPGGGWPAASLRRSRGAAWTGASTPPASTSSPARSTSTPTWSCPSAGTFAKDTFETGTRAAAFGGTTTIIDFAVQSRGQGPARGARRLACQGRGPGRASTTAST